MSEDFGKGPDEQIIEESVSSLINSIRDSKYDYNRSQIEHTPYQTLYGDDGDIGDYVFLIGAGTSSPEPAGIPTAGELIDRWIEDSFSSEDEDDIVELLEDAIENEVEEVNKIRKENDLSDKSAEEIIEDEDDEIIKRLYVGAKESEMKNFQNSYGFWFKQQYGNQAARRQFIRELVENRSPAFGTVVLGLLMKNDFVPITLTPNFDDLLFDAFYLFLDEKPQLINYDAIASQFKITAGRPTIVKLHGDHLNYNLRNTGPETFELSKNVEEALSRTLREYGLVVIGYGGNDESIMGVLEDLPVPTQGIYWCARSRDELSDRAEKLLQQANTFYVEIEGSDEFFTKVLYETDELSLPIPDSIEELGEDRADTYDQTVKRQQEEIEGEERILFDEYELTSEASELAEKDRYEDAIEKINEIIELGHKSFTLFRMRGDLKKDNENNKGAIKDYNKALKISEDTGVINSRGIAKLRSGDIEGAIADFERIREGLDEDSPLNLTNLAEARLINRDYEEAIDTSDEAIELSIQENSEDKIAEGLLVKLAAKIILERDISKEKEEYNNICSEEFTTTWSFKELENWLDNVEISEDKDRKIREMMDKLRKKKEE
jgi:tetratricopeptide (TPR) repeat protein